MHPTPHGMLIRGPSGPPPLSGAIWNQLASGMTVNGDGHNVTNTNSGYKAARSSSPSGALSTKSYFEMEIVALPATFSVEMGVQLSGENLAQEPYLSSCVIITGVHSGSGQIYRNNSGGPYNAYTANYVPTYVGAVVGVAYDSANGIVYFYVDNNYAGQASGVPAGNAWYPMFGTSGIGAECKLLTTLADFKRTKPSGYTPWNS